MCASRGQDERPRDLIQAEHPFPESSAYEKAWEAPETQTGLKFLIQGSRVEPVSVRMLLLQPHCENQF